MTWIDTQIEAGNAFALIITFVIVMLYGIALFGQIYFAWGKNKNVQTFRKNGN
jgi:hypothetical protein